MDALRLSFKLWPRVVWRSGLLLALLHLASLLSSQAFTYIGEYSRMRASEDIPLLATSALVELSFTLVWTVLWLIVMVRRSMDTYELLAPSPTNESLARPGLIELVARQLNPLLIESIRSFAAVIWRVPLLIVPALIEYLRLTFVPFVVLMDPGYENGDVDALERSREMAKGHWWLLGATLLVSALVPVLIEAGSRGDGSPWVWENPVPFMIAACATFFISSFSSVFLFSLALGLFKMAKTPPENAS